MSADEDVQVLMELGDENINFVAEESVPHKHLVFRIVNSLQLVNRGVGCCFLVFA